MPELISSLSSFSRGCWLIGLGLTGVGVALIVRKAIKQAMVDARLKHYREKVKAFFSEKNAAAAAAGTDLAADNSCDGDTGADVTDPASGLKEDGACIICMARKYDTIFVGCGHMCCCNKCARRCDKCPICRTSSDIIQVYSA
mmetsp:Transcript_15741/g.40133  ORF Transcript_15741/g.40133 Transcript_15741/m.40133 type:complete len:143 (+) Transcript_15741:181-609(+)